MCIHSGSFLVNSKYLPIVEIHHLSAGRNFPKQIISEVESASAVWIKHFWYSWNEFVSNEKIEDQMNALEFKIKSLVKTLNAVSILTFFKGHLN